MNFLSATFLLGMAIFVAGAKIPSFIKTCYRDDPSLGQCMLDSISSLQEKLKAGIDELMVPSLEPMVVGDLPSFMLGKININVKRVVLYGFSECQLSNVRPNIPGETKLHMYFSSLGFNLFYKFAGKVFILPVSSSGQVNGDLNDVNCEVNIVTRVVENKIIMDRVDVALDIPRGNLKIKDQSAIKSAAMNAAAKSNFKSMVKEYVPIFQTTIGDKFKEFSAGTLDKYTFDELFPPKKNGKILGKKKS